MLHVVQFCWVRFAFISAQSFMSSVAVVNFVVIGP